MKNYRFLSLQVKTLCISVLRRHLDALHCKRLPHADCVELICDLAQLLIRRRLRDSLDLLLHYSGSPAVVFPSPLSSNARDASHNHMQKKAYCENIADVLRTVVLARQHAVWITLRLQFPPAGRTIKVVELANVLAHAVLRAGFHQLCAAKKGSEAESNPLGILSKHWYRWRLYVHDCSLARQHACSTLFGAIRGVRNKQQLVAIDRWKRILEDKQALIRADVEEVISLATQCWIGLAPRELDNPQGPDLYQSVLLRSIVRRKRRRTLAMAVLRWIFQCSDHQHRKPIGTSSESCQTDNVNVDMPSAIEETHPQHTVRRLHSVDEQSTTLSVHQPSIEDPMGRASGAFMPRGSQASSSTGKSYFSSLERLVTRAECTQVAAELQACFYGWRQEVMVRVLQRRMGCQKVATVCEVVLQGRLFMVMAKLAGVRWEGLKRNSESTIQHMESVQEGLHQKVVMLEKEREVVVGRARLSQSLTRAHLERVNIDALRSGTVFVKFQWATGFRAPRGQRCRKIFTVHRPSQAECYVTWSSLLKDAGKKQVLSECRGVSYTFQDHWRFAPEDHKSLCFILVGQNRDVELCATSLQDFLTWFLGLQHLCRLHGRAGRPLSRELLLARYVRRKLTPLTGKDSRRSLVQLWLDAIGTTLSQITT
eukprot:GEMP01008774.1.p1 GENE.GEMP01008774.1~~GEMP01008774.1.p1  ORF type:complete len:669 (+),score=125.35 GEMP01008774.1:49-2007(+)